MMDSQAPILDIDNEVPANAPGHFRILLWLQLLYILYLIYDLWMDVHKQQHLTAGPFIVFLLFIFLPVAGNILLLVKKKAGWVISVFYFLFISAMMGAYLLQQIIRQRIASSTHSDMRVYLLFLLAAVLLTLLVTRENRGWLGISQKMLLLTLGISSLVVLPLVLLVMYN